MTLEFSIDQRERVCSAQIVDMVTKLVSAAFHLRRLTLSFQFIWGTLGRESPES